MTIQEQIQRTVDLGFCLKINGHKGKNIKVEVIYEVDNPISMSELIPVPSSIYDGMLQNSIQRLTNQLVGRITSNA